MLAIHGAITDDNQANKIIQRFVSDRILDAIQFELDLDDFGILDDLASIRVTNEELYDSVTSDISPGNVSVEEANEAFISLVSLLQSDQELSPSMLQNYQMFQLIGGYCDLSSDIGLEIIEKFPTKDRKIVRKALEPIAKEAGLTLKEAIDTYENMSNYETICFEDWDFLQLDNMTFDELKRSKVNKELGMVGPGETLNMRAQILKFPKGLNEE